MIAFLLVSTAAVLCVYALLRYSKQDSQSTTTTPQVVSEDSPAPTVTGTSSGVTEIQS